MARPRWWTGGVFAALGLIGCPGTEPSRAPEAPVPSGWSYEVRLHEGAAAAEVRVCLQGAPSARLALPDPEGLDFLHEVRNARTGARLRRNGIGFSLGAARPDDCFDYRVDFVDMARREGLSRLVRFVGRSLMVRQSMWLLHPDEADADAEITAQLQLPAGTEASVPWAPLRTGGAASAAHRYRLDWTVFEWLGYVVFGPSRVQRFDSHQARIELALLDAPVAADEAGLRAWIDDAVGTVASLYGRYPRDRLQVMVVPIEGGGGSSRGRPVYFGMAGRGGGAGVYLLLDSEAEAAELPGGWTTVHELLHHGMPFVDDAWMAEGWVSYYTELLRTRRGHRDERAGWQALWDGFERGRDDRRRAPLRELSATMHTRHAYQRVYWGGAVIALRTDLALRLDSGGEVSLDDAMRELRRCCGDAPHQWSADQLLSHLDAWYGKPLFSTLAAEVLDQSDFPDLRRDFARLGLAIDEAGQVVVDDGHPGAATRRSLMAPR